VKGKKIQFYMLSRLNFRISSILSAWLYFILKEVGRRSKEAYGVLGASTNQSMMDHYGKCDIFFIKYMTKMCS